MSLPESSRLDIDVRERRAERRVAVTVISLGAMPPWLLLDSVQWLGLVAGLLSVLTMAAGFHWAGWLAGSRRIERVVWSADGFWMLIDAAGRNREAWLAADSRVGARCAWLRWRVPGVNSMLLMPGDVPPDQLRRLSVRLRIDRHEPAAVPPAASI
jgi:hypothetical protein